MGSAALPLPAEIDAQLGLIKQIARSHNPVDLREASSPEEAARIWLGRKSAFGAVGQVADYMCLDGTIPVGELPRVLKGIKDIGDKYGLKVGNVFHAGDGNMHPLIIFDANAGQLETAEALGAEILRVCVEAGSSSPTVSQLLLVVIFLRSQEQPLSQAQLLSWLLQIFSLLIFLRILRGLLGLLCAACLGLLGCLEDTVLAPSALLLLLSGAIVELCWLLPCPLLALLPSSCALAL